MSSSAANQIPQDSDANRAHLIASLEILRAHLNAALRGKAQVNELVIACLLARGHLLIEDAPGVGKTTLAKALAQAVGGAFARVQCTPDLLPTDITGFKMFNQHSSEFEFVSGPIFCDVLLADELNRATPRTQSALFEAMSERQVTIDGVGHKLSPGFFVIATQNPLESHGVYPLPDAQLDRFTVKLQIGYPDPASESKLLADDGGSCDVSEMPARGPLDRITLAMLQEAVRQTYASPPIRDYLVQLGNWSRQNPEVECGLSPRALLVWQRMAKAWAFLSGRSFVIPDDLHYVAGPVLEMRLDSERDVDVVSRMLSEVPVPLAVD